MKAAVFSEPGSILITDRPDPTLIDDGDAVVRVVASCVCGSDLWWYRGETPRAEGQTAGHEFVGIVEQAGDAVTSLSVGDFVIAPFMWSCGSCVHCLAGVTGSCVNGGVWGAPGADGGQAELVRVPFADGTLVAVPQPFDESLIPSLLTLSDVFCTGYHAAISAGVSPGHTTVVVGDGAVGLSGVLSANILGATEIILLSRNPARQELGKTFGATTVIAERGDAAVAAVHELTDAVGADSVLECVGTGQSMLTAFSSARPGSTVGFVGIPHGVDLPLERMFRQNIGIAGGIAPARHYLPQLLPSVLSGEINPGLVFDQEFALGDIAQAYAAMDGRTSIKALIRS